MVVEIGSWQGKSSVVLGTGLKSKEGATLYCVDPFDASGDGSSEEDYQQRRGELEGFLRERFLSNLQQTGVREMVKVLQGYSHKVVEGFDRSIRLAVHRWRPRLRVRPSRLP